MASSTLAVLYKFMQLVRNQSMDALAQNHPGKTVQFCLFVCLFNLFILEQHAHEQEGARRERKQTPTEQ